MVGAGEVPVGEVGTGEVAEAMVTGGRAMVAGPTTHQILLSVNMLILLSFFLA